MASWIKVNLLFKDQTFSSIPCIEWDFGCECGMYEAIGCLINKLFVKQRTE